MANKLRDRGGGDPAPVRLPAGQKLDYIRADPKVCFTVYELHQLLMDPEERPCFTDTAYTSVVIQGTAALLTDLGKKKGP